MSVPIEVSDVVDARPELIWDILTDYQEKHPHILPKPYFTELFVEKGGKGAGTEIRVSMNVMGARRVFHMVVSEPEPGRVLVETDKATGQATTFTVYPLAEGNQSRVTITTGFQPGTGLSGLFEKLFTPPVLRHIYKRELQQLGNYASSLAVNG
jgi:uncharacterized protein YndB with AHSA1/START domain